MPEHIQQVFRRLRQDVVQSRLKWFVARQAPWLLLIMLISTAMQLIALHPIVIVICRIIFFAALILLILRAYQSIESLYRAGWERRLLDASHDAFATRPDSLYNVLDLQRHPSNNEMTVAYLSRLQVPERSAHSEQIQWRPLLILSMITLLTFLSADLQNAWARFAGIEETENPYHIQLSSREIAVVEDSTVTIGYTHNLPSLSELILVIADSVQEIRLNLNAQRSHFDLTPRYAQSGWAFLETRHSLWGKIQSDTLTFEFFPEFRISRHQVDVTPPSYTGLSPYRIRNENDVQVLKGSKVVWQLRFTEAPVSITSNWTRIDSLQYSTRAIQKERFQIHARDSRGTSISYQSGPLTIQQDRKPVLIQTAPAPKLRVANADPVSFVLNGVDDYGFGTVWIRYRVKSKLTQYTSEWTQQRLMGRQPAVFQKVITWPLETSGAFPGMDIEYQFIARDNDLVSGPKYVRTPLQEIHLMDMEEIFAEMNKKQDEIRKQVVQNMTERKGLMQKLETFRLKLKQKGRLTFNEKQELQKIYDRLDQLNKQIQSAQKQVQKMQEQMENNPVFSDQLVDQYKELQELMKKLNLPKMERQQPVTAQSDQQIKADVDNILKSEAEMQQEIERAKALFEKLREKQMRDAVVKRLKDMRDRQERINREADQTQSNRQQQQLSADVRKFIKQPDKTAENAASTLAQKKVPERMDQSVSQQGTRQQQNRAAIKADLDSLLAQMQQSQKQQDQAEKDSLMKLLMTSVDRLIQLSFDQEKTQIATQNISIYSRETPALIRQQNVIRDQMKLVNQTLVGISHSTFLFNPVVIKVLTEAETRSESVIRDLEQRQHRPATIQQTEVTGMLNQSILMLFQALQNMQESQSGLGEKEFMKQMQQMAKQQGSINQSTQSLWDQLRGQMSDQQRSGAQRMQGQQGKQGRQGQQGQTSGNGQSGGQQLGGQQSKLADDLKDLLNQRPGPGRAGGQGRGESMAEEMKKIADALKENKLDEALLKRQRRLLEKMLDAADAGKEKNKKTQRREKETAKTFTIRDIRQLDSALGQQRSALQAMYESMMRLNMPAELKQLIQNYYDNRLKQSAADSMRINLIN